MVTISQIEQLADRISEAMASLKNERDQLRLQNNELKNKLAEKELECIRVTKDIQRIREIIEREKLAFQREKSQVEGQMKTLFEKLNSILPENRQPQSQPQPVNHDGRGERRP